MYVKLARSEAWKADRIAEKPLTVAPLGFADFPPGLHDRACKWKVLIIL